MCGRVRLITDYSEIRIELKFDADEPAPNYGRHWNMAPTSDLLVALPGRAPGKRRPALLRWGLIPAWTKDATSAFATFNARAETIDSKPSFRDAWRAGRRCLVVTDGFYEWRQSDPRDRRQPFAVAMASGKPMVMAGLYESWQSPAGETIRTVTIVTTEANDKIAGIHPRMPVILAEEDWPAWLGEVPASEAELKALLKPCPPDALAVWPVDRRVGNVKNDDSHLVDPIAEAPPEPPQQASLF